MRAISEMNRDYSLSINVDTSLMDFSGILTGMRPLTW